MGAAQKLGIAAGKAMLDEHAATPERYSVVLVRPIRLEHSIARFLYRLQRNRVATAVGRGPERIAISARRTNRWRRRHKFRA